MTLRKDDPRAALMEPSWQREEIGFGLDARAAFPGHYLSLEPGAVRAGWKVSCLCGWAALPVMGADIEPAKRVAEAHLVAVSRRVDAADSSPAASEPEHVGPLLPEVVFVKVSTSLLPKLCAKWSAPLQVKAERLPDGTFELVFRDLPPFEWREDESLNLERPDEEAVWGATS
jgi:hypothetical protein